MTETGTIAYLEYKDGSGGERAIMDACGVWQGERGPWSSTAMSVVTIRPLIVLDLRGDQRYTIGDLRDAHMRTHNYRLGEIADQIEAQTRPAKPTEVGTLDEFHADGRQYLVPTRASGKFLEADSAIKRLQVAELVVEDGRVIKNRRGAKS